MEQANWWKKAVFYQIYPRSFCDSNGDGIGDINGIISKLDYLQDLGIDAIWLSPHYPSPMEDCGYDISDYLSVAPEYGTIEDLKTLIAQLHDRKMHLVTDLVLNHTSKEHAWFKESKSSKSNPKRDWYIWKPGKNGNPPNNWYSTFGGSAWELDPITNEYYYHFFFKGQPDLNWWNPEVKAAMFEMVRYWLDLGIDGFRLDAIGTIFEDSSYCDHKGTFTLDDFYRINRTSKTNEERESNWLKYEELFSLQHDQPGVHDLMKELRLVIDEYDQRVLIGETDDIDFYGNGTDELHLVFNFPLMKCHRIDGNNILSNQKSRLGELPNGAWPCNTLGNHDSPRMINRFGDGKNDDEIARINLLALLTLKGTPVLYNGEEIGMTDFLDISPDQFRDPLSLRAYQLEKELMVSTDDQATLIACQEGRDKCRTPIQWANRPNGGFCPPQIKPWLPINSNYSVGINVEEQLVDPDSLLNFYRKLLSIRKKYLSLSMGEIKFLEQPNPDVLLVERTVQNETIFVCINFSSISSFQLPCSQSGFDTIYGKNLEIKQTESTMDICVGPLGFIISLK